MTSHSSPVVSRIAGPGDAREIGRLYARSWRAAFGSVLTPEIVSEDTLTKKGQTLVDASLCLVAHREGELLGLVAGEPSSGLLDVLYVDPAAWGTGVAGTLMDGAEAMLSATGNDPWLWAWEGNERALRFYQRRGWKVTGVERASRFGEHLFRYVQMRLSIQH